MRLAVTFLGLDLFTVDIATGGGELAPDDYSRDLSGGSLGYDRIDAGDTDLFLGFTAGLGE